jgi:4-hydroxymandelate oxidase
MTKAAGKLVSVVRLADFEALARAAMEPAAFDYISAGSWDEVTLVDNDLAWRRRRFRPRVLVDVSAIDPSTTMLGRPTALPLAIAPMAVHGLADSDGEIATARAAAAAGIPFTLSTTSSRSIEEVAAAVPDGVRWFQFYPQSEVGVSRGLVERAESAGYRAIILTVDLPVLGYREKDRRSGFVLPSLGNFEGDRPIRPQDHLHHTITWADLSTIQSWSSLPLVLKGILTAEDSRLAVEHGVEGIVVSNHGARQLDRSPATVDVLSEVVDAVAGQVEVWVDGGIRRGLDIAIARALGAQGVLIGKPILWSLAAGGQAGVERALAIIREEFELALALLGTPTPADIERRHVAD